MPYLRIGFESRTKSMLIAMVLVCLGLAAGAVRANAECPWDGKPTQIAAEANTSGLWTFWTKEYFCEGLGLAAKNTGLGVETNTRPSIDNNGTYGSVTAFVANGSHSGELWTYNEKAGGVALHLGVSTNTSPSISRSAEQKYEIAFVANGAHNGELWLYKSSTGGAPLGLGVEAGTSPSVDGGQIAFQASGAHSHELWIYAPSRHGGVALGISVSPGTSPSLNNQYIAFVHLGELWTYNLATGVAEGLHLGVQEKTSPSIAAESSSDLVAFQANGAHSAELWTYSPSTGGVPLKLGMMAGTSPSIAYRNKGSTVDYEIAFQANTGELWSYNSNGGGYSHEFGMASGASPSIAAGE
jgi:hypothetical protein